VHHPTGQHIHTHTHIHDKQVTESLQGVEAFLRTYQHSQNGVLLTSWNTLSNIREVRQNADLRWLLRGDDAHTPTEDDVQIGGQMCDDGQINAPTAFSDSDTRNDGTERDGFGANSRSCGEVGEDLNLDTSRRKADYQDELGIIVSGTSSGFLSSSYGQPVLQVQARENNTGHNNDVSSSSSSSSSSKRGISGDLRLNDLGGFKSLLDSDSDAFFNRDHGGSLSPSDINNNILPGSLEINQGAKAPWLLENTDRGQRLILRVVTGQGHHSEGGVPVVKPAVESLLRSLNIRCVS
jgi:hypothetical protein